MLTRIRRLLERNATLLAVLCTIGITVLSLIKVPGNVLEAKYSDKISHVIAYFFLAFFWLYGLIKNKSNTSRIFLIALFCLIYGIIIEALQSTITAYRSASYLDVLANSMGIILAVLAFYVFEKKKRLN